MEVHKIMELPDYSPSTPAPDYSSTPLPGEKCIQRTPRQTPYHNGNCAFTYQEHSMSLTLRGCREEDGVPTFGLCSTIHGEFEPTDNDRIVSVVLRLEGRVVLKGRSQTKAYTLFSKERSLWERNESSTCPSLLPLSISFPATYRDNHHDRALRLPPSMSIREPHRAAVTYSLNIIVQKTRCGLFARKTREVCMAAYLCYRPRVRPPRPSPTCFSGLKHCSDEWQEEIWGMSKGPSAVGGEALVAQCHTIVEHLAPRPDVALETLNPIHVFLLRQTTVRTGDSEIVHEEVLGTGTISPSPTTAIETIVQENTMTMSWDGEVRCERPIVHTGFTTVALEVKDFLVLSLIVPPGPLKSIPSQLQHAIPIRLVTHPWVDRS
ncbi:hypothetical protein BU15DRAFT_60367 [Melanogaster broomeanus]|nr:hypothetical protein BU15DRAFT_60367 [Melanogaster broomeanus]